MGTDERVPEDENEEKEKKEKEENKKEKAGPRSKW
jgi:hypothetical protein